MGYLKGPHTRISESLLYASYWSERDVMIGIYVAPEAQRCTFIGTFFTVNWPDAPNSGAMIIGNTYAPWIGSGKILAQLDPPSPERTDL
jgi:hypothetical protein